MSLPREELQAVAVQAGIKELEKIMREHGLNSEQINREFLFQAVGRLWLHEDREALRAKIGALVDEFLDGTFEGVVS